MNKVVVTVGSGIAAGAVSKGLTGMIELPTPAKIALHLAICAGATYMASKVTGSDGKAAAIQGAYMGVAFAQGAETVKAIAQTPAIQDRISGDSKLSKFAQKSIGLSGIAGELGAHFDSDGNLHDDGMGGFIDGDGGINAYDEAGNWVPHQLNAAGDEYDYLSAADEVEDLNGFDDNEELNGTEDEYLGASEIEFVY